jgi:ribonuclease HI
MTTREGTIIAAADGSALGNPGPAGWAWYVDDECWASGGWPHGTNNMGELMAVLDLLRQTAHRDDELHVFCDSTYVINTVTKWMAGWKRRGWRKGDGKPVMNLELVQALDQAMQGRRVVFEWVKGHAGHELNEAADRRANAAALAWREGREPDPGPGFPGAQGPPVEQGRSPVAEPAREPDLFSDLEDATEPTDEERVIELERSLLTDEVRTDRAAVAALLHPGWQEVGRSGRLWTREELLEEIGPVEAVTLDVVSVSRVAPDALLLLWRASTDTRSTLRSSLWVRSGGGWQQVFHQATDEA